MKVAAATTLLFATLALASPAPVAQPNADAAPVAAPVLTETRNQLSPALAARDADAVHKAQLERRAKKPKGSSGSGNSTDSAADMLTPSRVLQAGALGLGVMEVVRLWVYTLA